MTVLYELHRRRPDLLKAHEVYIDGGVRRGTDVLKALCLGARGVGLRGEHVRVREGVGVAPERGGGRGRLLLLGVHFSRLGGGQGAGRAFVDFGVGEDGGGGLGVGVGRLDSERGGVTWESE